MSLTLEEKTDLEERLNDVELEVIDAKEFTHLSSEAFELLQTQINEIRTMLEQLLIGKPPEPEKKKWQDDIMYF